jgi:hypothetical protein
MIGTGTLGIFLLVCVHITLYFWRGVWGKGG